MEYSAIYLALFLAFLPLLVFLTSWNKRYSKKLPPGSLGLPLIGHNLQILKAMRDNKFEDWLQERVQKHGPMFKFSFVGFPMVFLHGPTFHKFIFTADENILSSKQPSFDKLMGERNLLSLTGDDHKRWRLAMSAFLNPEALKHSVGQMDHEIRIHLKKYWQPDQQILVMPRMQILTFDVFCSVLFGVEKGKRRDELQKLVRKVIEGFVEIPINLPFTNFSKSKSASVKAKGIFKELIHEKRAKLERGDASESHDIINSLVSMRDESNAPIVSDEEIMTNCIGLMIAGHDTTSILLSFVIKILAENQQVYETVLKEQEEIAKTKAPGEALNWDDLNKMKYTWRTAQEALRLHPPVSMSYRTVVKDIELGGYTIPKGWKVMWTGMLTQRDESVFPDPNKVNPLRHENPILAYNYVPFGAGPRMCPGIEFARTEALTMIHYLVTQYQWKLSSKENNFSRDPMPFFKHGLPIHIEMKKPHHA